MWTNTVISPAGRQKPAILSSLYAVYLNIKRLSFKDHCSFLGGIKSNSFDFRRALILSPYFFFLQQFEKGGVLTAKDFDADGMQVVFCTNQ